MKKLLAPNGKPSNLTDEQYKLVRTKAFKDWFGDWENAPETASKVIDENGEPLVVYHASFDKFNIFSKQNASDEKQKAWYDRNTKKRVPEAFYFTDNKEAALEFAVQKAGGKLNEEAYLSNVFLYQVFLNIRNPEPSYLKQPPYYLPSLIRQNPKIITNLQTGVYDGLISMHGYLYLQSSIRKVQGYTNDPEDVMPEELWGKEYIVIHSNQIKLADGTNNTFDADNRDIRYDDGGEVKKNDNEIIMESTYRNGGKVEQEKHIFGKYAFADNNNRVNKVARKLQNTKEYEKDTPLEDKVYDLLLEWTQTSRNAKDVYAAKKYFEQAKSQYPEIFSPQSKGIIYRGLSAGLGDISFPKKVDFNDLEKVKVSKNESFYLYKKPIRYTPRANTESWTTNINVAKEFSGKNGIILISKIDDSYYMNPKIMNEIYGMKAEDEVIKLGKDFVKNVFVMFGDLDEVKEYLNTENLKKMEHLKFSHGGEMKTIADGGITYGKSHAEGGIKVHNKGTGETLEVEGGESVTNKRTMAMTDKVEFNGEKMTPCEVISELNQMGGGVAFDCGDVQGKKYKMEDGGELAKGIKKEKEHMETFEKLYHHEIKPKQAPKEIAEEHLSEDIDYYKDLRKAQHICSCNKKKKMYMNGGIFDKDFGSLDDFIGGFENEMNKDEKQEIINETLSMGRDMLDKDYLGVLMERLDPKLHIYFVGKQSINLYKEGWRLQFGSSKEWAGLCSSRAMGSEKEKKGIFLSIQFTKHDKNWLQNYKDVIYHEMAHAIVQQYIPKAKAIDQLHEPTEGHGIIWTKICSALNPDGVCERYYKNANYAESFKNYMYSCRTCGAKKYGDTRTFTDICFKCKSPVIVVRNKY